MELYINSVGSISGDGGKEGSYPTSCLYAAEPDYTAYIKPMQLRRMSKAVRMGIGASTIALEKVGLEKADALSAGTAMGCLADTEVFLKKLIDQEEQMLTPTAFIQSTHNTVAGQIALHTKCNGHNMTYVHRGHSFEHAMINTQLYLNDNPSEFVLTGGLDELTDGSIAALQRGRVYTSNNLEQHEVLEGINTGAVAGEGATFFVVSGKPLKDNVACVKDVYCFSTKDTNAAIEKVSGFAQCHEQNVDLVLLGDSGDKSTSEFYTQLRENIFKDVCQTSFKHLCGEYAVSSAYALSLLVDRELSDSLFRTDRPEKIRKVIIVNHFMHYYNCWYVELAV
ncbi:MAG: beta-ketoacyl synthase N-terminal-like domain-containing protein [Flavipsychrobacter sp.]